MVRGPHIAVVSSHVMLCALIEAAAIILQLMIHTASLHKHAMLLPYCCINLLTYCCTHCCMSVHGDRGHATEAVCCCAELCMLLRVAVKLCHFTRHALHNAM